MANPRIHAPKDEIRRFFEAAISSNSDACIIWPYGHRGDTGYASMGGRAVHRLVCAHTHGPPSTPRLDAAHHCGIRNCINPHHIRWATRKENFADELLHGTRNRGVRNGSTKLTEADVREIRQLKPYLSETEIAAMFKVARPTIGSIMQRQTWVWLV
jgi:L-2-hydroxyglutarate oxidase LhgO